MVYRATSKEMHIIAEMAIQLLSSHTVDELEKEFANLLNDGRIAFFVKFVNNVPVGFAQCSLRNEYVEGTSSSPVGYLEGIFVCEKYRNKGIAKELLTNCEKWAKTKDCVEFASDCDLDNIASLKFHEAMKFVEVNRIICFKKNIL